MKQNITWITQTPTVRSSVFLKVILGDSLFLLLHFPKQAPVSLFPSKDAISWFLSIFNRSLSLNDTTFGEEKADY